MAETPTEVSPLTFEVDRAGRRFPLLPEATKGPPQGRIRELQVQPTEEALGGIGGFIAQRGSRESHCR